MKFELFSRFDPGHAPCSAAQEFYDVLERMREAARASATAWSAHPTLQQYAGVCFWMMRRMEYGFTAGHFAKLESERGKMRVLDAGCGVVPLCNWMSRRGHDVTALEPLPDEFRFLTTSPLNDFYGSQVTYVNGRCEQLPFADSSFDVVTCVSVLERIVPGNDRWAFHEMARVLKPGGRLIITFDVAPPRPPQSGEGPWPTDMRRFDEPFEPATLESLIRQIAPWFAVSPDDIPGEFYQLTWEQVHDFWAAAQEQDGRDGAWREYLAMGTVLERRESLPAFSPSDVITALLEGQTAIAERLSFYQLVAALRQTDRERLLRTVGEQKENIRDLKKAAKRRLP